MTQPAGHEFVVRYRQAAGGGSRRIVGIVLLALGVLAGLALLGAAVAGAHLPLATQLGHGLADVVWGVLVLIVLVAGIVLIATGGAKNTVAAPDGVAWVLERGGVLVPLPGAQPARVPWGRVRFERTTLAGAPAVRVHGPGVDRAYPVAGLSAGLEQIDAEARRLSSGR